MRPRRGNELTSSSSGSWGRASNMRLCCWLLVGLAGARRERLRGLPARARQRRWPRARSQCKSIRLPIRRSNRAWATPSRPNCASSCSATAPTGSPLTTTGTSWSAGQSSAMTGRNSASSATDVLTVRDYRLELTAQVTARERSTGKVILDQPVTGLHPYPRHDRFDEHGAPGAAAARRRLRQERHGAAGGGRLVAADGE